MSITQEISVIPPAGQRGVQTRDDFVTTQEAFQDHLVVNTVDEMNTLGSQMDSTAQDVNNDAQTAVDAKNDAEDSAVASASSANNKGDWSALTGALDIPASVSHANKIWVLDVNLADVTASEPSSANTDWTVSSTPWAVIEKTFADTGYTLNNKQKVYLDSTGGATVLNFPATPLEDDQVWVIDRASNFSDTLPVLGRNGSTIMGIAEDFTIDLTNFNKIYQYNNNDWRVL